MFVRNTSFGVLIAVAIGAQASTGYAYNLTARDVEIVGQGWVPTGIAAKPCGILGELLSRLIKIEEALSAAGKSNAIIKANAAEAKYDAEVCYTPQVVPGKISKLAVSIRDADPAAIAPYFGGLESFFTALGGLAASRKSVSDHRTFAKWSRTMLQPCLGDKVLASVVSASICTAPVVTTAQSYSQSTSLLDKALDCSGKNELELLKSRLRTLNAQAKGTKSCASKAAKSKTVASLCEKYYWFHDTAPSICRLAVGKKP